MKKTLSPEKSLNTIQVIIIYNQYQYLELFHILTFNSAAENSRGDPMKYGAYRRWKMAEQDLKKPKPKKKNQKSGLNPDSFLNSIKNIGKPSPSPSSSTSKGTGPKNLGQGFGTRAEPPPNMSPITPKKPM